LRISSSDSTPTVKRETIHWQTDGEWKESVVRAFLRRHLPRNIEIGRGFVITEGGPSTQIDVLIYDSAKPILFQDGALVFVTADAVLAVLEVKTSLNNTTYRQAVRKLSDNIRLIQGQSASRRVYGLFSFEDQTSEIEDRLNELKGAGDVGVWEVIDLICLGDSTFIRFWEFDPQDDRRKLDAWRAYTLKDQAPGYFIHNVVQQLCPESVEINKRLWYPPSKAGRVIGEVKLMNQT
jgi:hypothetical protein